MKMNEWKNNGIASIHNFQKNIRIPNDLIKRRTRQYMSQNSCIVARRNDSWVCLLLYDLFLRNFLSACYGILFRLFVICSIQSNSLLTTKLLCFRFFSGSKLFHFLNLSIYLEIPLPTFWSNSSLKGQLFGMPGSRGLGITFPSLRARLANFFSFLFRTKYYRETKCLDTYEFSSCILLMDCLSLALCLLRYHM